MLGKGHYNESGHSITQTTNMHLVPEKHNGNAADTVTKY
jgi:hypothetical protein